MITSFFSLWNNRKVISKKGMSNATITLIVVLMLALIIFIVFVIGLKGKFDLINP